MVRFLFLLSFILLMYMVCAFHFKFGHIAWKPDPSGAPNTVEITVINGFLRSWFAGSASDGFPAVGDLITEEFTPLTFGDGDFQQILQYRVLSIDVSEDWLLAVALQNGDPSKQSISHQYPSPLDPDDNPWVVRISGNPRIYGQQNNPGIYFRVSTTVETVTGNSSPLTSITPIVNLPRSETASFTISALDIDPNTNLVFRLAEAAEAGIEDFLSDPSLGYIPFVQPSAGGNNLTITPNGLVQWNTMATSVGQLWSCQIVIEDRDATTNHLKTKVAVDFFIKITDCPETNTDPTIEANHPELDQCRATLETVAGEEIKFDIKASDPDNEVIKFNSAGIPLGSQFSHPLPLVTSQSPITTTFTWIPASPTAAVITFTAIDECGAFALCQYSVIVGCPQVSISLTSGSLTFCRNQGSATLTAFPDGAQYLWSTGETTKSISVSESGTYSVTVSKGRCEGTDSIEVLALDLPVVRARKKKEIIPKKLRKECFILTCKVITETEGPYSFSWGPNRKGDTICVCPMETKTFSCITKDANGCESDSSSIKVNIPTKSMKK